MSFDTEPRPLGAVASLTVNEVELMLDEHGMVLYVTGYCPFHGWRRTTLRPPDRRIGRVMTSVDNPIVGTGLSVFEPGTRWEVQFDPVSNLLRMTGPDSWPESEGIEFAPGAVAEIHRNRLIALWLKPTLLA